MSLVLPAHAMGFAASWITEWYAYDQHMLDRLGVGANERIAGFVHIGRPAKPPEDRDRPKLETIVTRYTDGATIFYEPDKRDKSVLPNDPFKAIVAPRPIGWITSISSVGEVKCAPYSYFNGINGPARSGDVRQRRQKRFGELHRTTGEFELCNLATWDLREAINATSAPLPRGVNEMIRAGLEPAPSRLVKPPRVKAAACALECKLVKIVSIGEVSGKPVEGCPT